MEGGLAGVDRGMLPDQCKEGGVGQVSHQLQPWPSSLLLSLSHTLSAPFNHRSQPLVLPWSLSSPPINQSLLPPFLPQAFAHLPPPLHCFPSLRSSWLVSLLSSLHQCSGSKKGQAWEDESEGTRLRQWMSVKMREWVYLIKVLRNREYEEQIIYLVLFPQR